MITNDTGMIDNGPDTEQLSDQQRALLEAAVEEGYFEVPRQTSLVDLAAEHDMTGQRASQQLREGLDTVLRQWVDGRNEQ